MHPCLITLSTRSTSCLSAILLVLKKRMGMKSIPAFMNSSPSNNNAVFREVAFGGMTKPELLEALQTYGVELNDYARLLFDSNLFQTSARRRTLETVELSVLDLGFAQGATAAAILKAATARGLALCPLELGPHLRLQNKDQPEGSTGFPPTKHCAPPGSITIASEPLAEDDDFPKGFYLRRIEGTLWLKAYCASPEHVRAPEDRLVFCHGAATSQQHRP
jgi:hypothetical protein